MEVMKWHTESVVGIKSFICSVARNASTISVYHNQISDKIIISSSHILSPSSTIAHFLIQASNS